MILVEEPEKEKPLGRPKPKWAYKIKMDFVGDRIGQCGVDWSGSE
jgi:hypothetical protein